MPRNTEPKPHEELVSYEVIGALAVTYEQNAAHPIAQLMLAALEQGRDLWKVEMEAEFRRQEANQHQPRPTVKSLEQPVKGLNKILIDLLKQAGRADKVEEVKKNYADVSDIAQHLIETCRALNLDAATSIEVELEKKLKSLALAKARVAAGGHPIFDAVIASLATRLWIIVDDAFDGLRIIFRQAGITEHPIFALYPTVKTPLRPAVGAPQAATSTGSPSTKAAKKASTSKTKPSKAATKPGTTTKPPANDASSKGDATAAGAQVVPPPNGTSAVPPPSH